MKVIIARCSVDYSGRLNAHLPLATRALMLKNDGSLLIHSDGGSYKPLNWMRPPCILVVEEPDPDQIAAGVQRLWRVSHAKTADVLVVSFHEVLAEIDHDLGDDPGLIKEGVESHLQQLLSEQLEILGPGFTLVRREFMTAIGPVDILARDEDGRHVAIELKRRGDIDGVEQLTRYLELLNRDSLLRPVTGIFAAQEIKPQARTLAEDRGIRCVVLDYDAMRGVDDAHLRLF